MTLPPHEGVALEAELDPGIGVDGVVDAPVAGHETTQQGGVRGVDDGIRLHDVCCKSHTGVAYSF